MSPGHTFERVYLALKAQLGSGRFVPGESLEPARLSDELLSSITPVRDALHRLVGERLVDAPRNDGFRAPPMTEVGLRHLYAWNLALLTLAIKDGSSGDPSPRDPPAAPMPPASAEALFTALADRNPNPELRAAVANANDRLRPIRQVEPHALPAMAAELDEIEAAGRVGDRTALRRHLVAYHRRRERAVALLVAHLQQMR